MAERPSKPGAASTAQPDPQRDLRVPHPCAPFAQGRELNAERRTLNPARRRASAAAIAILCACMVLFAATLRIAHSHSAAEEASGHCPICVAIHTAMPAASAPVQVCMHTAPERIVTIAPKAPEKVRVTTLSDRAPPAIA